MEIDCVLDGVTRCAGNFADYGSVVTEQQI